jgi:hypothetical protein
MSMTAIRRKLLAASFQLRQARVVAKAMKSRLHPIVAHIVPIRRCNLSCTYCNEYDDFSKPVPTANMLCRIDRLAELGTSPQPEQGVPYDAPGFIRMLAWMFLPPAGNGARQKVTQCFTQVALWCLKAK